MKNQTNVQPEGTRIADIQKLQEIMHYHGLTEFKALLKQAFYNASEEMESIDQDCSERYQTEASRLEDES